MESAAIRWVPPPVELTVTPLDEVVPDVDPVPDVPLLLDELEEAAVPLVDADEVLVDEVAVEVTDATDPLELVVEPLPVLLALVDAAEVLWEVEPVEVEEWVEVVEPLLVVEVGHTGTLLTG